MKDLTHYFQFPAKEGEDKNQKEVTGTTTLNGDCDEIKPKKMYNRLSEHNRVVENNSPLSLSSLEIKSCPLPVHSSSRRITRSQHVTNSEVTNYADSTESVELGRHSTIFQDSEDVAIFQRTSIRTSGKIVYNETSSQKTENVVKQEEKRVSQCDIASESLPVKSEVLNEIIEDSSKKKKHSLLFQRRKISAPSIKLNSVNSSKEKSLKLCTKITVKRKELGLSLQKSTQIVDTTKHDFETDTSNKSSCDEPSNKVCPILNENTNAFHILMSSGIWQSPHGQSPDETEDKNLCTNADRKQTTTVVADTSMDAAKRKENRQKRKRILEQMSERRRGKRANLDDTSSEIEIEKTPVVRSKRIVCVSESDSDDTDMTLDKESDNLKARYGDVLVHREGGRMVVEESDDESAEDKKQDKVMDQDSLTSSKLDTKTSKKMERSRVKLVHENNGELLVDVMKVGYSEPEQNCLQLKKLVVKKLNNISTKQVMKISAPKYRGSCKKVRKERWKLAVNGEEKNSVVTKKEIKMHGVVGDDRMVDSQLSVCEAKMSLRKLPKTRKEVVVRCNKSAVKSSFQKEVKPIAKKFLDHQENFEFCNYSDLSESCIVEDDSEEEEHMRTGFDKEDKRNRSFTVRNGDSDCEMLMKEKKYLQDSDSKCETKKRNSLFSYFNKVCKDEVLLKPEKIRVKVQIHSPPVSPSLKTRWSSTLKDKRERRQGRSMQSKVLDMEDQIVVLESHIEKPTVDSSAGFVISTPKKHNKFGDLKTLPSGSGWRMRVRLRELPAETASGEDSSDDCIFTPKRKCIGSKTTLDHQETSEVLLSSKTMVNQMNAEQTKAQDNNVSDEVAEGEADEVTIYSSHYSMSDAIVKLAPLFVRSKAVPKPKVDPAVVEARQNFLKSGIPESVKKMVDMQRSMEEQYHFTFPTVAHVQQQGDQLGIWNLPLAELPLRTTQTESFALTLKQMEVVKLGTFSNCHNTDKMCTFIKPSVPKPITCFRKLLHLLKLESPDFPIYRDFRRLHLRCIQDFNKPAENVSGKAVKEKGGRSRKSKVTRSKVKIEEERKENCDLNSHVIWTEKYKPTTADDIVGNGHSIGKLKNWLENWKHYSDVQHGDKGNDCKRKDSSSGDEFMDCDSNDTSHRNLPNNTAILVGPHGCGKTSAVYAIANELGFKVLEINTSSKRNGRRILSELQEATQSHQVRAGSEHASDGLNPFFKGYPAKSRKMKSRAAGNASKPKESGDDHNSGGKMSVILVEGVDVVYEDEDEGFVSAVNSLVASSKRPVILITNEPHYPHLARLMELHLVLKFSAPPSGRMSAWLQSMCLLEGVRVRRTEIERLLDQNSGDVRQTVLQLQFWVLTGGNNFPHTADICDNILSENPVAPQVAAVDTADDHSNLSYISGDEAYQTAVTVPEHANCIETFTEYYENFFENCRMPFPLDLGRVWWNLASLLPALENSYQDRIFIQFCDDVTGKETFREVKANSDKLRCLKVEGSEVTMEETESVGVTISGRQVKNKVVLVDERLSEVVKMNSEESLLERVCNDNEKKGNSISELLELQRTEKKCCQEETDCMFRLMETISAVDVLSRGGACSREPCVRSWDQVPKDGTSFNEGSECLWWQGSVSRLLCHYLLEGSVHKCRTSLEAAQSCHVNVHPTRVTYTKPTQQELRWRMAQHAADEIMLPIVPLWCRPDHHSVASDYMPVLRAVSRNEQDRLACSTKRRNRFFHYLKGLNVHANDATLNTLCAVFASMHTT